MATTLKALYGSVTALTVTNLASLATDTNLLAGWQSDAFDNSTNLYDDVLLAGTIKAGSSAPTANTTFEIWVAGSLDAGTTWPDTITGSQGTVTLTSTNTKNSGLYNVAQITVDATANRVYPLRPIGLAQFFGGVLPVKLSIFVVQNSGQALGSSGQVLNLIPVQYQGV